MAARRMLEGLRSKGVDARMLVGAPLPKGAPEYVSSLAGWRQRWAFYAERAEVFSAVKFDRKHLFRFSSACCGVGILSHPWVEWADVIHIHWVQHGFLSLRGLQGLLSLPRKKIYWSLHDLWPLTGGCHIPYTVQPRGALFCQQFMRECLFCPLLHTKGRGDLSTKLFSLKHQLPLSRVHFLGVSREVVSLARSAPLLEGARISLLPNFVDPQEFFPPTPADEERSEPRILMVAARLDDPVKGLDLCQLALERACAISPHFQKEVHLVLVGRVKHPELLHRLPIRYTHLERVTQEELRGLYQSASVTLSTSRYETFGQTLLESIACGTPAIAFRVGGTPDIIQEAKGGGALVPNYDIDSMASYLVTWTEPHRPRPRATILLDSIQHLMLDTVVDALLQIYFS